MNDFAVLKVLISCTSLTEHGVAGFQEFLNRIK